MPSPKQPPTIDELLRTIRLTSPPEYHEPILDGDTNATGQIYRGNARTVQELTKVVSRSATRQRFVVAPGFEPAGPGTRSTMLVLLDRSQDLDMGLLLEPGTIVFDGPRGRVYRNEEELQWFPGDITRQKSVELVCDWIGEPGNLDFLANEEGKLVIPGTQDPGTDVLNFADLSQSRSGIRGVLEVTAGQLSSLTDDGAAPTFSPRDVGLYLRINFAGNASNIGRVLRIVSYEVSATDSPAGSGLFPRIVTLDDGPLINYLSSAQLDDGGVFTDQTAESRSTDTDDVQLLPAAPAVNDASLYGATDPFGRLELEISTALIGDVTIVWEYWDGAVFSAIPGVTDGTEGFTIAGRGTVMFEPPVGWATTTINGVEAYYVRARASAFVSQFQQPLGRQCFAYYGDPLLADPLDPQGLGQISWTILDPVDLGVSVVEMTAPAGGRDDDLGLKLAERGVTPKPGEDLDVLRRRASRFANVVSPTLIEREINQILEPFGLAGKVTDPGDGFTGLFWDVPVGSAPGVVGAWDLYEPGDLFPVDKSFLTLGHEDRWIFWVCVPPPSFGEFGAAWDKGPPSVWVESYSEFVGGAWDYAFTDGYAWLSSQLYKEVYEQVEKIKAGGIDFTLVQCDVPTCA